MRRMLFGKPSMLRYDKMLLQIPAPLFVTDPDTAKRTELLALPVCFVGGYIIMEDVYVLLSIG